MAMIIHSISKQIEKIICQNITVLFEKKADDLIHTIGQTLKDKLDGDLDFMKSISSKIEATLSDKLQEYYNQTANQDTLRAVIEPIILTSLSTSLAPMLQDAINKNLETYEKMAKALPGGQPGASPGASPGAGVKKTMGGKRNVMTKNRRRRRRKPTKAESRRSVDSGRFPPDDRRSSRVGDLRSLTGENRRETLRSRKTT
jgi:hypothetical protein